LKEALLPPSSRQLAEAHYKLGLVLDLTSGRLADALVHVRRALDCTDARLSELRAGRAGDLPPVDEPAEDKKGKGKATGQRLVRDPVAAMSKGQIEAEIKELEEVLADLKLKVRLSLVSVTLGSHLRRGLSWRNSPRQTTRA
jgi:HAT1-interacting factor 1